MISRGRFLGFGAAVCGLAGIMTVWVSCVNEMEKNRELLGMAYKLAAGNEGILSRDEELKFYKDLGITHVFKEKSNYSLYNNANSWATLLEDGREIASVSTQALEKYVNEQRGEERR